MNNIDLNSLDEKELIPGYFVRFVHSENMTVAYWNIKPVLPYHHIHILMNKSVMLPQENLN